MAAQNMLVIFADGSRLVCYASPEILPVDSQAVAWVPVAEDYNAYNYSIENGALIHTPPPPPPPAPNVDGFQRAIFEDENIPAAMKVGLYSLFPMLEKIATQTDLLQQAWQQVKSAFSIPLELVQIIEQYADAHNIPLVS